MQLIPELAKEASELTVYQRTPIWVMPKIDFGFSPAVQRLFARVPLRSASCGGSPTTPWTS